MKKLIKLMIVWRSAYTKMRPNLILQTRKADQDADEDPKIQKNHHKTETLPYLVYYNSTELTESKTVEKEKLMLIFSTVDCNEPTQTMATR